MLQCSRSGDGSVVEAGWPAPRADLDPDSQRPDAAGDCRLRRSRPRPAPSCRRPRRRPILPQISSASATSLLQRRRMWGGRFRLGRAAGVLRDDRRVADDAGVGGCSASSVLVVKDGRALVVSAHLLQIVLRIPGTGGVGSSRKSTRVRGPAPRRDRGAVHPPDSRRPAVGAATGRPARAVVGAAAAIARQSLQRRMRRISSRRSSEGRATPTAGRRDRGAYRRASATMSCRQQSPAPSQKRVAEPHVSSCGPVGPRKPRDLALDLEVDAGRRGPRRTARSGPRRDRAPSPRPQPDRIRQRRPRLDPARSLASSSASAASAAVVAAHSRRSAARRKPLAAQPDRC